ncbi:unnamed protein product [Mesocestoides corti]|uniref:Uncharacterized protein n=1 Tax=Mesocestoides corti TaxID=53468 RepID=A0A0R3UKV0_MESCO|nr:unnamed protein product [Mesocestoides corti]
MQRSLVRAFLPLQKPVKRRALRKRRPEEDQIYDDSDTSSSSTCEEAVYDATTAKVVESAVPKVADETPLAVWTNRLSCIEEKSCLTSGLDSSNDEEDIVVHYGDNDDEEERQEIKDDILEIRVALQTNSSMPITAEDVADFDQAPRYTPITVVDIPEKTLERRKPRHYISVHDDCNSCNSGYASRRDSEEPHDMVV